MKATFWKKRLDPESRYGIRVTLFALAFGLVGIPFGILLQQVVTKGGLTRTDLSLAQRFHAFVLRHRVFVGVAKVISALAAPWFFLIVVGAACAWLLFRVHRRRIAAFLGATTIGGGIADSIVKIAVNRPRPAFHDSVAFAHGRSFPSGHSMGAVYVYGALLLAFMPVIARSRRRWAIGTAVLFALLVGAARLSLGVHFLSDVLGGYVLGLAWLALSTAAFATWREERGKRPVHPTEEGVEPEAARALRGKT